MTTQDTGTSSASRAEPAGRSVAAGGGRAVRRRSGSARRTGRRGGADPDGPPHRRRPGAGRPDRRGPRAGDPRPGAGRRPPGGARHARVLRDRHRRATSSPRCGGSATGTGATSTASSTCSPTRPTTTAWWPGRSSPPSRRRSPACRSGSATPCWPTRSSGQDTRSLAGELGSTAGAVAAQLNRTRARLRVEYLLALDQTEPPTERCRPVLLALSSGDRRRQREVDAARHLLECDLCARLSEPLMERGQARDDEMPHPDPGRRRHRRGPPGGAGARVPARVLPDRPDPHRDGGVRGRAQHRALRRPGRDRRRAARPAAPGGAGGGRWTPGRASPTSSRP